MDCRLETILRKVAGTSDSYTNDCERAWEKNEGSAEGKELKESPQRQR